MAWHRGARFGCFVHWGVYSALGNDSSGQRGCVYAEHIMRVIPTRHRAILPQLYQWRVATIRSSSLEWASAQAQSSSANWVRGTTNAFLEGLNSVFSAVKRKARGFRSTDNLITMLYFTAGKLDIPVTH